jgi:hypothetical protein
MLAAPKKLGARAPDFDKSRSQLLASEAEPTAFRVAG